MAVSAKPKPPYRQEIPPLPQAGERAGGEGLAVKEAHQYDINGISIAVYDEVGSLAADWVAWEMQADDYRLREIHFDEGDIVIDIGAHIGLFSIYLAKRWPFLKIFAFEPFPANFENCMENLRLNNISNVSLHPKAITHDARLLRMATDLRNSGGASAIVRSFVANGVVDGIVSTNLDEVFSEHAIDHCKLLKIDCEGIEYEILFGARVLERVEYLVGEFHRSTYLQSCGFSPERLYTYCSLFFPDNRMTIQLNEIPG